MKATNFAVELGRQFAAELNGSPADAQDWSEMSDYSDIPDGDYKALVAHYGEDGVTREVERAYKRGFNEVFASVKLAALETK